MYNTRDLFAWATGEYRPPEREEINIATFTSIVNQVDYFKDLILNDLASAFYPGNSRHQIQVAETIVNRCLSRELKARLRDSHVGGYILRRMASHPFMDKQDVVGVYQRDFNNILSTWRDWLQGNDVPPFDYTLMGFEKGSLENTIDWVKEVDLYEVMSALNWDETPPGREYWCSMCLGTDPERFRTSVLNILTGRSPLRDRSASSEKKLSFSKQVRSSREEATRSFARRQQEPTPFDLGEFTSPIEATSTTADTITGEEVFSHFDAPRRDMQARTTPEPSGGNMFELEEPLFQPERHEPVGAPPINQWVRLNRNIEIPPLTPEEFHSVFVARNSTRS